MDTDLAIDGQIVDRIIEITKNENLGDLQVIEQIWETINEAYERELI
jgi:hypothetical protein